MATRAAVPPPVGDALNVWLRHHDDHSPGLVEGLYVVGSAALGNWQRGSDIDIVAFTAVEPKATDVAALRAAHRATRTELSEITIDGPRLAWADVAAAPAPRVRPWTLDHEFHVDDACFELNPVIWHTLANHALAVRGPDRRELPIHDDALELHAFVIRNTDTYWRSVASSVAAAAADPSRESFDAEVTAWCVLGIARMMYTAYTGAVVSKSAAGEWIADRQPEYRDLVAHALAIRHHGARQPDRRDTVLATAAYMQSVIDRVTS